MPTVFDWHPAALLQRVQPSETTTPPPPPKFALIVLNQTVTTTNGTSFLWNNALLRVAADGGANHVFKMYQKDDKSNDGRCIDSDTRLDVIIGDLDSLLPPVEAYFAGLNPPTKIIHDTDMVSTDFGKALQFVRSTYPVPLDIAVLGGLDGRIDQALSQLHHLYAFQPDNAYLKGKIYLVTEHSMAFLLKPGYHRIWVRDGSTEVFDKHIGIIPIGAASVITTKGLEWDLKNWETSIGGNMTTSNHVLPSASVVEVETTNTVLFTIARLCH